MFFNSKYIIVFFALILCVAIDHSMALADSGFGQKPWTQLETKYTIIKYKSNDDLLRFHNEIDFGPGSWNRSSTFSSIPESEVQKMLIQKIDAIFKRAREILDMQKKIKNIHINIYPDSKELKRAYSIIYRGKCNIRAWYRFRNHTVYINARDVHAGMLAHEIAHGIIDHFFKVKPPSETAEILARYVDSHL